MGGSLENRFKNLPLGSFRLPHEGGIALSPHFPHLVFTAALAYGAF
jgi:hypothetical protein